MILPSSPERARAPRQLHWAVAVFAAVTVAVAVAVPSTARASATTTSSGDGATSAVNTDESPIRRGRMRIVVQTTSERVEVLLPGASAGHLVVGRSANRTVTPTVRGVVVTGAGGTFGAVGVDVVTENPVTVTEVPVTVRQGAAGSTKAWVENRTADPVVVAAPRVISSNQSVTVKVPRDTFFGPTDLELSKAVAPEDRQVLAFTYPWFSEDSVTDPELSVHPTDPLLANQFDSALEAAALARANGIDGFVLSFAGGKKQGLALHQALEAAAATDGTATPVIEAVVAGNAATVEQWIREALRQSEHPAFLRYEGLPVVFVWGAFTLDPLALTSISDRLTAEGTPIHLVSDAHLGRRGILGGYRFEVLLATTSANRDSLLLRDNFAAGRFVRAGATLRGEKPGLVIATAEPGFDDRPLRGDDRPFVEWEGTATYDTTWRAALPAEPDWVVINSWNEWYEGTGIAPSVEHGDTALRSTATWADRLRERP